MTHLLILAALAQTAAAPPAAPAVEAPAAVAVSATWLAQDPADSLYKAGRSALSAGNYREAARLFAQIRSRYPRSDYAPDSYYWEAFARSRIESMDELREAVRLLDRQEERHADARTASDARSLRNRVLGELARRGDEDATRRMAQVAAAVAPAAPPAPPGAARPPRPPRGGVVVVGRGGDCDEEDDERLMALSALMNMRSELAVPILKQVLEKLDAASVCLRRKAVFLVSQKRGEEVEEILLGVVRHDPDQEVREQAVFWLSQVNTPEAVAALDSILQHAADRDVQEKAIFALSQQRSEAASQALRSYLERRDTPDDLKENVVFWLGQRRDPASERYLKELYGRTQSRGVKEKIIFSLSQRRSAENADWLLGVVENPREDADLRANALFWAGQMREVNVSRLGSLYGRLQEREMKEKIIFGLSQRREPEAVDALMNIVRTETDQDLRKKAIFWLGQSRDPRAAEFLLELINR